MGFVYIQDHRDLYLRENHKMTKKSYREMTLITDKSIGMISIPIKPSKIIGIWMYILQNN